jgi:hypothetical protein
VIPASEGSGFFKTQDVRGSFDHTEQPSIALAIRTNSARLTLGQSPTPLAGDNALAGKHQCFGQNSNPLWLHLDDMERQPLG